MADVLHPLGYTRVPSRRASQQEMKASAAQEAGTARTLHGRQSGQPQLQEQTLPSSAEQPLREFGRLLDFSSDAVALGGHRGLGMNLLGVSRREGSLLFRENTLASMRQAAALGATFVEFDVQVTADGVPVIWHDDYVVTGRPQQPQRRMIADMELKEFQGLCSSAGPSAAEPLLRQQASVGETPACRLWRVEHDDSLPTLAQLFEQLPPRLGFDIEVKMTTPHTAERTEPAELERVAGPILEVVRQQQEREGGQRPIAFTSFDPDMCRLVAERQSAPVMLLSDGGQHHYADARRNSVAAAIEHACSAGLAGLVLECAALRTQPDAVERARDAGLQVLTFGVLNDEPEWVRRQFFMGVHGVIADNVACLSTALSQPSLAM